MGTDVARKLAHDFEVHEGAVLAVLDEEGNDFAPNHRAIYHAFAALLWDVAEADGFLVYVTH